MKEKSSIVNQIPNLLTSINVMIGCIAITMALQNNLLYAGYLIFVAGIVDFLDGFMARKLNAVSEFGKILDSLSDVICFGVTPAVIMYRMLIMALTFQNPVFNIESASLFDSVILYTSFLLVVFGAIRLARFSTQPKNNKYFYGLPIPAMAIVVASMALLFQETDNDQLRNLILNSYFLVTLILLLSLMMVSNIRMFSLKFENVSFRDNKIRYIFLILSVLLLIPFQISGILLVIFLYILMSIANNVLFKAE